MPAVVQMADVFPRSSMGMLLLEARANSLPVILTDKQICWKHDGGLCDASPGL